jgi:hypothetical protein
MPTSDLIVIPRTDDSYRRWTAQHESGFVVNTRRPTSSDYMVLHRVGCSHISRHANPGAFTEHDYAKVCAESIELLSSWTRDHGRPAGDFSGECGHCSPRGKAQAL